MERTLLRGIGVAACLLFVASAASAQGRWEGRWRFRHRGHRNVQLRIAGDYSLPQGTTVEGPVILIGGTGHIDGHVEDDVVVVGGTMHIGPTAEIDGDVSWIGGTATIDPAATIHGEVTRVAPHWPQFGWTWPRVGDWWSRGFALGATIARLCFTFVGGVLLIVVAPGRMRSIADRVMEMPGISVVIGLGTEMFLGPAIAVVVIALVISIVGIPLLLGVPVILAVLACLWIAGFAATAARLGASIRGDAARGPDLHAGDFVVGFVVLTAVTVVGRILAVGPAWLAPIAAVVTSLGLLIEYCAWTLGLGAAVGALFAGRRQAPPRVPPIPTPAT